MHTNLREAIEREIEKIISESPVPEDYKHAKNVKEWVLQLKPDATEQLKIAALSHDIERAIPERKVRRENFKDYNEFKKAHAINSSRIIKEILENYPIEEREKERIRFLVENHEFGQSGDEELAVLVDSDVISFFQINLPYYAKRNSDEEVIFRIRWGLARASERAISIIKTIKYRDEKLNQFLRENIVSENPRFCRVFTY